MLQLVIDGFVQVGCGNGCDGNCCCVVGIELFQGCEQVGGCFGQIIGFGQVEIVGNFVEIQQDFVIVCFGCVQVDFCVGCVMVFQYVGVGWCGVVCDLGQGIG